MDPTWVELTRITVSILAAPAAGLLGVYLGGRVSTRREGWLMKRDHYTELIAGLQATRVIYRRMEAFLEVEMGNKTEPRIIEERYERRFGAEIQATRDKLYRAGAVGYLTFDAVTVAALERLEHEELETFKGDMAFAITHRREALEQTLAVVLNAARQQVGEA